MMKLPDRIFFTGVPGSRWSGIAQVLESLPGFNTSDRTLTRSYEHNSFSGHKGAYFGRLMEFDARLDADYLQSAWSSKQGTCLVKSHDWAYSLDKIKTKFPDDWIVLVHRPDDASFTWWKQAGGFNIQYPSYTAYQNDQIMQREISWQNQAILQFAEQQSLVWNTFTSEWISDNFGQRIPGVVTADDIRVAILK
jgi:hypothetical protein